MIYSMTGYAAQSREFGGGTLHMELKSVNSRFLDLHFRMADELRASELGIREKISALVKRGKVECRLAFTPARPTGEQSLNLEQIGHLHTLDAQVRALLPEARPLSVRDVLAWPGVLGDEAVDFATFAPNILELLETTLAEFNASRAREGEKLAAVILEAARQMRGLATEVAPHIPAAQASLSEKLRARLTEALSAAGIEGAADESRVLQEVTLFAARIDVAEELARLHTHLDELERIFRVGGSVGKRLDFLMQELNREANTLGSKAAVTVVTQTAMHLKLLIEQIREQVQNLE
ncbi:MAG: YicC family protein [Zoogloeaceae bacterium]|jgi:uncharacterized protein (TIGR00255 family)|nr:YicC family protein [Zoogloeaceae bacterium]